MKKIKSIYILLPLIGIILITSGFKKESKILSITADSSTFKHTRPIDGFGVNINPALWNNGSLKPAIDFLVDELGCTLFRFDCYGQANWLDPSMRDSNGKYSDHYLDSIYTTKVFKDSWATFRYLNSKGVETMFNVSGKIPAAFASGKALIDFNGYAEMVVTMLDWAKNKEGLRFSVVGPFNETDFGPPEGPQISNSNITKAVQAIITKLQEHSLSGIKLDVMDDLNISQNNLDRINLILNSAAIYPFISNFGFHTYWTPEEINLSMPDWWAAKTGYGKVRDNITNSSYQNCSVWMSEYGHNDLGATEWSFLWYSAKRLLKAVKENFNAGIYWDAFDNYHKHDAAWTTYGLLHTDTVNWIYTPKKRFYALKQIYKYVKPGYELVKLVPDYVNHTYLLSFVSPDRKNFTIVGMSETGADTQLNVNLDSLTTETYNKKIIYYRTSQSENCSKIQEITQNNKSFSIPLLANSIFTLTTDTIWKHTDSVAPTIPSGLVSSNISMTGFTVSWTASTDSVGVTGYDVYLDDHLDTSVYITSANFHGLAFGTSHIVTVLARDGQGNTSLQSSPISVKTLNDTEAPDIPAGLVSDSITEYTFILKWNASIDNVGVSGYDVYKNSVLDTSVTGLSATLSGLTEGTIYSMTVKSKDAAGNVSLASSPLEVTTKTKTSVSTVETNSILIYPNPTSSWVDIQVKYKSMVSIIDLQGKTIISKNIDKGTTRLALHLEPGMYYIRVLGESNSVYTGKLLVE